MNKLEQAALDLLEGVDAAIKAGDWKVDGACDPGLAIHRLREALAEQTDGEHWSPDDMAYRPSGLSMDHIADAGKQIAVQEPCIECGRPTMSAESKCNDCHSMDDAAPVRTKDLTDDEITNEWESMGRGLGKYTEFARAVIAADREKNK